MTVEEKFGEAPVELPPIPGIVVIPGNIGFLHQYFSALAIVTNGAPEQSNLLIRDLKAEIVFPDGEDLTAGSDATPGDDPLRMAAGADGYFPRIMDVLNAGADGQNGTGDDISQLYPAQSGQADFTIEGLKEGTHKLDFIITATLEGLPIGPVTLTGHATGAVLVRNPDFALTMSHPSTVRSGEEYDLFITVTNTSQSMANLVSVHLDPRAISGAAFVENEGADKEIDSIAPGSSETVRYRLVSQRTGAVTATVFESDEIKGRFNLRTGVGENGIPLSPDSLILPYTGDLAPDLVESAVGLLGQAWSVATAPSGALPADVLPIAKRTVTDRAFDLSEAGLRILIGDQTVKAVEDFTLDILGSDKADHAFDALRRSSTQGLKLNQAIAAIFQQEIDNVGLMSFQSDFADKVSYRPGHLSVVTSDAPVRVLLSDASNIRAGQSNTEEGGVENYRELAQADQFILSEDGYSRSSLILATDLSSSRYRVDITAEANAQFDLGVVLPDASGELRQVRFNGVSLDAGAIASVILRPGSNDDYMLSIDYDDDGQIDEVVPNSGATMILDHGPQIVAATQVVPGFGPGGDKHGRNIAILFSETVTKESAQNVLNYAVDANEVKAVNLQPGGRMAFLLLRDGIGPFFERNLNSDNLVDLAGLSMNSPDTRPIRITAQGPAAVVDGVVREANGAPVPNATVRLMQYIWYDDGFSIEERYAIFSEKQADANGAYHFDYVLQN
ncbi:MAG: hypothetical protein OET90_11760, partial [Desulfuromonadales bacterium]|nr:hypothetical protein [Desulfuromonadales bacterium]